MDAAVDETVGSGSRTTGPAESTVRADRGRWGLTFQRPRLTDPRLHVASVIVSVQVLGQVSLGFELSIAQILVSLLTAVVLELVLTVPRTRVIAWPASAALSGNGVALILRVPGTEHGDWWSLRGWYVFAAASALAVLSKYVARRDDRPLFNPSNLGLVVVFLVLGSGIADPQDLWWGPMSAGLALTYAVVVIGGIVVTRRLGLLVVSATFWVVFAALMGVLALAGHSMTARWNLGPVEGMQYWTTLVLSPEILIFLFFMITDPRTAARGRVGGAVFASGVAIASGVLIAFQTTEYATKVALLSGLVVLCAARPLVEKLTSTGTTDDLRRWLREPRSRPATLAAAATVSVAALLLASWAASPEDTTAVTATRRRVEPSPQQVPLVELGEGLARIGGALDQAEAERVVADVVEAILLADRAVEVGDDELAAAVALGPYLEELRARPAERAPERTVDEALVDVVRDPDDFQAQPRLAITFVGARDGDPWSATYHVLATTAHARIEREVPTS